MITTLGEDEGARSDAVRLYAVLDTEPETVFDELTQLAAQFCRTPMAAMTIVDDNRLWFKSSVGEELAGVREQPRATSFCHQAILRNDILIIPNTTRETQFGENPLVSGAPHVRFYAGVPLVTDAGKALGTLNVMDNKPRLLSGGEAAGLRALAHQVMTILELRRRINDLTDAFSLQTRDGERARWQSRHDALTGLPNRVMFLERIEETLRPVSKKGEKRNARRGKGIEAAVLFIDLDRFKRINDTLGHAAGDALLREVAARFTGCLRPEDTLARLGGDEFTVLLPNIPDLSYAEATAQILLRTLRRPIVLGNQELFVGASIGISFYPGDGEEASVLLKNADVAMYKAKATGGYQSYQRSMNANGYQRLNDENELRRAVERDELSLSYQPQLDLKTGTVVGVEALVRWRHPERGLIPPAHFIAIAEQSDLMLALGDWVLQRACRDAAEWYAEGHTNLRLAVNLSSRQLAQPNLAQNIEEILTETGLPGNLLDLELTEIALCARGDATPQTLRELRQMGARLFVDDFGTGYSSLISLRRFTLDVLKIDNSFVAGLGKDTPDNVLVRALIEMAHALGLQVIAEGVETQIQFDCLRMLNCDMVQGYLFSRPVSREGLRTLLISGDTTEPMETGLVLTPPFVKEERGRVTVRK